MTHTYHNAKLALAAAALREALTETRADGIPFAATNHVHAAIAQVEQADDILREDAAGLAQSRDIA